ncbi:type II secretion system F family protein [Fangia hongkongensis]|uniref:type II secretion system F family protein n=1 Tax=Fangia hongkongensis TaxID=270495 RepID=UPI00035E270D|nr:type II secretion system F family protein [Fangia hongkongensis]MBK2124665.1 type II secretion system F family protein [Fangia hongkongensis]
MILLIIFLLALATVSILGYLDARKQNAILRLYFGYMSKKVLKESTYIRTENLISQTRSRKSGFLIWLNAVSFRIGGMKVMAITLSICMAVSLGVYYLVSHYTIMSHFFIPLVVFLLLFIYLFSYLKQRRLIRYVQDIPTALGVLSSNISSGKSLEAAYDTMLKSLRESIFSQELKRLNNQIKSGKPPEEVFTHSLTRFPYRPYVLFVATMMACYKGGNSFKKSLNRIAKIVQNDQRLNKRKRAISGEARASILMLACFPFVFFILMSFVNPESIHFLLNDSTGIYVVYYLLISEASGILISYILYRRAG